LVWNKLRAATGYGPILQARKSRASFGARLGRKRTIKKKEEDLPLL
jgi:hypothetical protein